MNSLRQEACAMSLFNTWKINYRHLLMNIVVLFAVDSVVSRTVSQLFIRDFNSSVELVMF